MKQPRTRPLATLCLAIASTLLGCLSIGTKTCPEDDNDKTPIVVTVLDHTTKQPLCDATVTFANATGGSTTLAPRPATSTAPCTYAGGGLAPGAAGSNVTLQASRLGYQDTLTILVVPAKNADCDAEGIRQTLEMDKLL